ncbi:MAG: hypothetical protein HY376_04265 [Candidatus Blackburnbacteria bacterium]|nr:hypothetical protein [Candidatus Blackburnbacteria bacterium]
MLERLGGAYLIKQGGVVIARISEVAIERALVRPIVGAYVDLLTITQRIELRKLVGSMTNNLIKGKIGQWAMENELQRQGWTKVWAVTGANEKGIDAIFEKSGQYMIVEAKYVGEETLSRIRSGAISNLTSDELTSSWIQHNLDNLHQLGALTTSQYTNILSKHVTSIFSTNGKLFTIFEHFR